MKAINLNWSVFSEKDERGIYVSVSEICKQSIQNIDRERQCIQKFNDFLFDFLKDFYSLAGYIKIDESEWSIYDRKLRINELRRKDELHTKLLLLKKVLYMEVNKSLRRIEKLQKRKSDDKFYSYDYEDIKYFELVDAKQIFHILIEKFMDSDYFYTSIAKNASCTRELLRAYEDWRNYQNERMRIRQECRIIFILKEIMQDSFWEKVWLLYVLTKFEDLFEEEEGRNFSKDLRKEFLSLLLNESGERFWDFISRYVGILDGVMLPLQTDLQKSMIYCWTLPKYSKKMQEIEKVYRIIKESGILAQYTDKKGGCFAVLKSGGSRYIALSGYRNMASRNEKLDKLMRARFVGSYQVVTDTNNVRYYYEEYGNNNIKNIDYIKRADVVDGALGDEAWRPARMFSCCERKIISFCETSAKLRSGTIYVKYAPCRMCRRALEKNKSLPHEMRIIYPKEKWLKDFNDTEMKKFDRIAEEILNITMS